MEQLIAYLQEHRYVASAAWFGAAVVLAGLVHVVTTRLLPRLTRRTKTDLDDEILRILGRPLFMTVVLIGAFTSIGRLDPGPTALFVVNGLIVSLAVLVWAGAGLRVGRVVLTALSERGSQRGLVQPRTLPLFVMALKAAVFGGAAYGVLLAWDVNVTAWLASAGILGIAIGFAAKDTLSNLFSGVFILADAPYKIGDYVVLGTGERGRVTDIGIRSTRVLTRDDIEIIVPNAVIAAAKIVNETSGPYQKERVRISVGVAYGSDIDLVRATLLEVAGESSQLCREPEPRVRFREFGDFALKFQLLGWIEEPALRGRAVDELNTLVYKRFAARGIVIAYPQLDVHLRPGPGREPEGTGDR
jgi:small-conductance mechanosensitive channel